MGNHKCITACRLVNVDIYTFDFKLNHIAKHLKLPAAPRLGPAALDMPQGERLPPVMVVNVQLPAYPVSSAECCLKACLLFCFLLFGPTSFACQ